VSAGLEKVLSHRYSQRKTLNAAGKALALNKEGLKRFLNEKLK